MTGKIIGMFIFNVSDTVISNLTEVMCNTEDWLPVSPPNWSDGNTTKRAGSLALNHKYQWKFW